MRRHGDCLPECPAGAIEIIEREAEAYDEAAVKARMAALKAMSSLKGSAPAKEPVSCSTVKGATQWPVQIRLVPGNAAFLEGADVLVAADCTATPAGTSTRGTRTAGCCWWAARSWTPWTTRRS